VIFETTEDFAAACPPMQGLVGLDLGDKTIGVAVSDSQRTVASPQSTITATNDGSRMFKFSGGTTLDEIVHAVNAVGAAPGDLIAILEALKQAGALSAELEVI